MEVAKFYDNSGDRARVVLIANGGAVVWRSNPFPDWLALLNPPKDSNQS
jgi:hypothetical protein